MKVAVLGGGLVGGPMALDLCKDSRFEVTVIDFDQKVLDQLRSRSGSISFLKKDLSDPEEVTRLVEGFDLVVNAVPGFMGYRTAEAVIRAGKDCACIAFYEEDPFELDALAREKGVTMIMDCGVYPGMGSALIMDAVRKFDEVHSVLTLVGGLPVIREWPSDYKAVFSPVDVIEEYIRPARYIEHGVQVSKPALSDAEYIFFPETGTLEAFNTDGLRTLAKTVSATNLKEKTLRYPGHIEKMAVLRELGFFSKEKILNINGQTFSPLEFTGKILFPNWKLKEGEEDLTIFKSTVTGKKDGRTMQIVIDLYDRYSKDTGTTSMARTTGYTATVALRMIADGVYKDKGISPPEYMGRYPECISYLLEGLEQRGVHWRTSAPAICI